MGCASSKEESGTSNVPPRGPEKQPSFLAERPIPKATETGGYACFLSHFKVEAATEARWLQQQLEEALQQRCFLDSDDLQDLTKLKDHVCGSKVVLLLQTRGVLTRPWCLVELVTAIEQAVPIIGVSITSGAWPYDFRAASDFMKHLDSMLEPEVQATLVELGLDVQDAAYKLSNTLPNIISIGLNMNESRKVLSARVEDVLEAMGDGASLPTLPDKATWLASRGSPPEQKHSKPATSAVPKAGDGKASLPPEVPTLPDNAIGRPEIIGALKARVLQQSTAKATAITAPAKGSDGGIGGFFSGLTNATAAAGMGGVGKTMTAAALVRDAEVRGAFDKICWVSVGQEPDVLALQQTLHRQLARRALPEGVTSDALLALEELKEAAKGVAVLLVLDDVWLASHATPLNFLDGGGHGAKSAVVITTRVRALLSGAAEVQCGTLSSEASLELLLRAGGCAHLLPDPPPAAVEAVELCGRLPLALGIAGGIIEELADTWAADLVPLLKEELSETVSVEERVITASLSAIPHALKAGAEAVFTLLAIFPEDATVPIAAIDVALPLTAAAHKEGSGAQQRRQARKCLQQLLKINVIRGSIEGGISVHDLVRDCMIRRAETGSAKLLGLQRQAIPLMIAAFDAGEQARGYVAGSLRWHVRSAQQPDIAVHADMLMMEVLTHGSPEIRRQGALGVGVDLLHAAADACDAGGEHLRAAELMHAACAVRGTAGGAEASRAWASLKQLEEVGRGSSASRELESKILASLIFATEGGFDFGSAEHNAVQQRMRDLASLQAAADEAGGEEQAGGAATKEATMTTEFNLGVADMMGVFNLEGIASYTGPATSEKVVQGHALCSTCNTHLAAAVDAAPDTASALAMRSVNAVPGVYFARRHALTEFRPEETCGDGGSRMREAILGYDFETVHPRAKQLGLLMDMFMFGLPTMGVLLFFGDVKHAKLGSAKIVDAHKRALGRVRSGLAKAEEYAYEVVNVLFVLPPLALNDLQCVKELVDDTLLGATLDDESIRAGIASYWQGAFASWHTDDGRCSSTIESSLLVVRGLRALVDDENTDEARAALRAWLPPCAELLRIAEHEGVWRAATVGANHPALLCARLYGERLGEWQAAVEVSEGILQLEPFNHFLRVEAHRLHGRACAALGRVHDACAAAERAVADAAMAKYVWLEWRSLNDLLSWCGDGEVEAVRSRLRSVAKRMKASPEELKGFGSA